MKVNGAWLLVEPKDGETSHVVVEYDTDQRTIVQEHRIDFPSDADAEQFARDVSDGQKNYTAFTWRRWYGRRAVSPVSAKKVA